MVLKSLVLALAMYSTMPAKPIKVSIPENSHAKFRYQVDLRTKAFGLFGDTKKDIGRVNWQFHGNDDKIGSNFNLIVRERLLIKYLKADNVMVNSYNSYDDSPDGIRLSNYEYAEKIGRKVRYGMKVGDFGKGLEYICKLENKNKCKVIPKSLEAPDLFAILASVAYLDKIDENKPQPAFYEGRVVDISLKKEGTVDGNTIYKVEKADELLAKPLEMRIWLNTKKPHYMQKAEIEIKLITGLKATVVVNKISKDL